MIRRLPRARSGITLTEILISILILGIGVLSLATLFPIGLLRLQAAARSSRSAYLFESATDEMGTRNLLAKGSFLTYASAFDPWLQDNPSSGAKYSGGAYRGWGYFGNAGGGNTNTTYIPGSGLPVAYDPLWWATTGSPVGEARFGAGIDSAGNSLLRNDPDGGPPSAHGLQRLTNFSTFSAAAAQTLAQSIFVSPEDLVLNDSSNATGPNGFSPVLPDLSLNSGSVTNDWRFSWMFTGRQSDVSNGTVFDGDIVVFENRPFLMTKAPGASGGTNVDVAEGERVVEAIFGYGSNVSSTGSAGYAFGADRAVLLRWPANQTDPEIKVGGWIADVTYERNGPRDFSRRSDAASNGATNDGFLEVYPYQRCYWYQLTKKTAPDVDPLDGTFRAMTVWVGSSLRAKTLLKSDGTGTPVHVNAALVSPFVVNVLGRTIYTR